MFKIVKVDELQWVWILRGGVTPIPSHLWKCPLLLQKSMKWRLQKIAAAAALSISTDCFTYSVQLQALKKGDPSHQ